MNSYPPQVRGEILLLTEAPLTPTLLPCCLGGVGETLRYFPLTRLDPYHGFNRLRPSFCPTGWIRGNSLPPPGKFVPHFLKRSRPRSDGTNCAR